MSEPKLPTAELLAALDEKLKNADLIVGSSMKHIKEIQGWKKESLQDRFVGLSNSSQQRFLWPSYSGDRPLHYVAAFSWMTMVPMTFCFKGIRGIEEERGIDSESIKAIIRCIRLSKDRFEILLNFIDTFYSQEEKDKYEEFSDKIYDSFGCLEDFEEEDYFPPGTLDMPKFSHDYYTSIAHALLKFREINGLKDYIVADALGISLESYKKLERLDVDKSNLSYSIKIGLRSRLAFQKYSHVEFSERMIAYKEFHNYRRIEHIREALLTEKLRIMPMKYKAKVINIMDSLSETSMLGITK